MNEGWKSWRLHELGGTSAFAESDQRGSGDGAVERARAQSFMHSIPFFIDNSLSGIFGSFRLLTKTISALVIVAAARRRFVGCAYSKTR